MTEGVGGEGGSWIVIGWAALFAASTSVGLAALAWVLIVMDVLVTVGH